ncbi:ABC transporter [Chitinophaga silvatica]|uniref:ABC transporter n=1 Tax=Chitinophaga silvatica TaxID=2282649 RepID=A0A3E1Y246_9BACT|nr:Gldg family protein [Chitinophaga silvatica]RFS18755.1 ABC transporter [Chitinophaga silvatica]
MKTIFRITKAELRNLFYSPVAWFLTVVFSIQCGYYFSGSILRWTKQQEMMQKSPTFKEFDLSLTKDVFLWGGGVFSNILENLYLFIPLLTMGILSREVSSGSIKLLYSSPIKIRQIVLGKYLAIMIFNLFLVAIVGILLITSCFNIKSIDYGILFSACVAFYLLTNAYAAVGLLMSSLTTYQIVSAISTFVIVLILSKIGGLWQNIDFVRDLTYFLSMSGRTGKMLYGLLTTKDIFYFVIVISLFLMFTMLKLRSVRETKPWYVKTARYLGVLAVALMIGYITSRQALVGYWDTTNQKVNTIHPRVQKIIQSLDAPLEVTLYTNLIGDMYYNGLPEYRNRYLSELWEKYLRFNNNIEFKYEYYYDASPKAHWYKTFPGKDVEFFAKEQAKNIGVNVDMFKKPEEMRKIIDLAPEDYRLVMQLKYKGKTTFLRTYNYGGVWPEEEHVAAAVSRLLIDKMPTVLFTTGNLERGIDIRGERGVSIGTTDKSDRTSLINNGFDIDTISLATRDIPYDSLNIAALVLADPKTALNDTVKRKIQEYIDRGKSFMALGEPKKAAILNPVLQPLGIELVEGTLIQISRDNPPDILQPFLTKTALNLADEQVYYSARQRGGGDGSIWMRMETAIPFARTDSAIFDIKPIVTTDTTVWLKKGVLVRDSVPPVLNPAEGDRKDNYYAIGLSLTRQKGNTEQRILALGDADFMSNKTLGRGSGGFFVRGLFSWLDHNQFPIYGPKDPPEDTLMLIGSTTAEIQKTFFVWIFPATVLLIGTIILIRRKRK